jgi:hypothetical protein
MVRTAAATWASWPAHRLRATIAVHRGLHHGHVRRSPRRPAQHEPPPSRHSGRLARMRRAGPRWVRGASETAGPRRARAVMLGECGSQVTGGPPFRPRTAKQHWTGFEPLSPSAAGLPPLPTRQASPRTGLTLPPSCCHRCQAPSHVHPHRPCPGRALSIGRPRSSTDNKGQCVSPPSCRIAPHGAVRGSFPSSRCHEARLGLAVPGRPLRSLVMEVGVQRRM